MRGLLFFATLPLYHSRNVENTRLRLIFSTFPSCSQMAVVFYHSVIHGLGFSVYLFIIKKSVVLSFPRKRVLRTLVLGTRFCEL